MAELGWPLCALAPQADHCSPGRPDARYDEGEVGEGGKGVLSEERDEAPSAASIPGLSTSTSAR